MHILGLCNGSLEGNSGILLKIALTSAQKHDPSITTSLVHIPSISIPKLPGPYPVKQNGQQKDLADDRDAMRNAILDADAIIISTPTYSHQPAAHLKLLMDTIGGPKLEAALLLSGHTPDANTPGYGDFRPDERLRKPRVLGFIAVCGDKVTGQWNLVLPGLHLLFYALHPKVVDQYVAKGFISPGAVLTDEAVVERVKRLGKNIADQVGRSFDEALYLGEESKGACPNCHLRTLNMPDDRDGNNEVECITCGTRGRLVVREDGSILPEWEADSIWSCQTLGGKMKHNEDVAKNIAAEKPKMSGVQEEKRRWNAVSIPLVKLPSHRSSKL